MKMNCTGVITALTLLTINLHVFAQSDTTLAYRKPLFDFDYTKPVFALEKESNANLSLRYGVLTGYREGVASNSGQMVNVDKQLRTSHLYWNNLSVRDLLMINLLVPKCRFLFEVSDSSRYNYEPEYGDEQVWLRQHGYCFEYMMPAGVILSPSQRQKFVEGLLGLDGKWEKRKVKCLAIVRTSAGNKLKVGGKPLSSVISDLEYLFGLNEVYGSPLPLVDDTGLSKELGVEGKFVWTDGEKIRKQLQAFDLDLVEKEIETNMYVVKEITE